MKNSIIASAVAAIMPGKQPAPSASAGADGGPAGESTSVVGESASSESDDFAAWGCVNWKALTSGIQSLRLQISSAPQVLRFQRLRQLSCPTTPGQSGWCTKFC